VRIAWFHCFSGVAGDMVLGALLDAGADLGAVRASLDRLGIEGWKLDAEPVQRAGLQATRALVRAPEDPAHPRRFAEIRSLLAVAELSPLVRSRASAVFGRLATVEGRLHGIPVDEVHFHEVGALDAIVDVVGSCAALDLLGVDAIHTSPVTVGLGSVRAQHGELPNPAPATLALLADAGIAVVGADTPVELATPTGAALLAGLSSGCGPLPLLTPSAVGYGAGGADTAGRANVVQVVIGETSRDDAGAVAGGPGQPMVELAANLDDATGEVLAHTIGALLAAGANDAWVTPIVMKKGRPAHTLHALCDPAMVATVGAVLVAESGSLGLRATTVQRWPQARHEITVDVDGQPVRVKRAGHRIKAELDDAVTAAEALGRPLRDVLAQAEHLADAARRADSPEPPAPG
jgi:uncharacterized protein (TIGR00299 family) protein